MRSGLRWRAWWGTTCLEHFASRTPWRSPSRWEVPQSRRTLSRPVWRDVGQRCRLSHALQTRLVTWKARPELGDMHGLIYSTRRAALHTRPGRYARAVQSRARCRVGGARRGGERGALRLLERVLGLLHQPHVGHCEGPPGRHEGLGRLAGTSAAGRLPAERQQRVQRVRLLHDRRAHLRVRQPVSTAFAGASAGRSGPGRQGFRQAEALLQSSCDQGCRAAQRTQDSLQGSQRS